MVSKNQIKWITSLHRKKNRLENQLFIAEGVKVIQELLQSNFVLEHLFTTDEVFNSFDILPKTLVSEAEMNKITALSSASSCLAVFEIPKSKPISEKGLIVALDDIRDPGNLGTIIRLCDWFGIEQIICSNETVDVFNPKVIQATMGSIARVNIEYLDIAKYISNAKIPVFGTFMDGKNIYSEELSSSGIIVFGNEANGISSDVEKMVTNKIAIPRFGKLQKTESLNVATATAIILSEFSRRS
jgi:TrmH family RNA methyltransferase